MVPLCQLKFSLPILRLVSVYNENEMKRGGTDEKRMRKQQKETRRRCKVARRSTTLSITKSMRWNRKLIDLLIHAVKKHLYLTGTFYE